METEGLLLFYLQELYVEVIVYDCTGLYTVRKGKKCTPAITYLEKVCLIKTFFGLFEQFVIGSLSASSYTLSSMDLY